MNWTASGIPSQSPAVSTLLLYLRWVQLPITIFLEFLSLCPNTNILQSLWLLFCFICPFFHTVNFTKKKKKFSWVLFFSPWQFPLSLQILLEHSRHGFPYHSYSVESWASFSHHGLPSSISSYGSSLVHSLKEPSVKYLLTPGTTLVPGKAKMINTLSLFSSSSQAWRGDRQVNKLEQDVRCRDTSLPVEGMMDPTQGCGWTWQGVREGFMGEVTSELGLTGLFSREIWGV